MPPTSAVRTFNDPDEYEASIRGARTEFTITGRGRFNAKLIRIDLHRLWMQQYSDNLARVGHFANIDGRAVISFRTIPGPSLRTGGIDVGQSNIILRRGAQSYFQRSEGPVCFGAMSLPVEEMTAVGSTIVGYEMTLPRDAMTVTPRPAALKKLRQLYAATVRLAEHAPEVIAHPEAARGLEQALIGTIADCLVVKELKDDRLARRHHASIIRRFRAAVEEKPDQALFIPELCTAIGVSQRTLRVCCQEQLGMSPKRYLLTRRMHMTRRALRESSTIETTVTEIATRFGFWQFGRFAGEYKVLFGESPSVTLARPSDRTRIG